MASRGSVNEWIERYLHYGKVTLHTAPVGSFNMCFRENVPGSYFVIFLTFVCSCVIGPDSRPLYLLAAAKVFPRASEIDPCTQSGSMRRTFHV